MAILRMVKEKIILTGANEKKFLCKSTLIKVLTETSLAVIRKRIPNAVTGKIFRQLRRKWIHLLGTQISLFTSHT